MDFDPFGSVSKRAHLRNPTLRRIKRMPVTSSRGFDWAYFCWKKLIQADAALHSLNELLGSLTTDQHRMYVDLMHRITQLDPYQRSVLWSIASRHVLEAIKKSGTSSESA